MKDPKENSNPTQVPSFIFDLQSEPDLSSFFGRPKPIWIAVSGGFDPIHIGHIRMLDEAKRMYPTAHVLVILNTDEFLKKKKGKEFMRYSHRHAILEALRMVDRVVPAIDKDDTVCESLAFYRPNVFANGGDRKEDNVPEVEVCKKLGIKMVWNVGGDKLESSSELTGVKKKK